MGARFAAFGLVLAGILAGAFASLQSSASNVHAIFFWLALILAACALALRPFAGRDQGPKSRLERSPWPDRIGLDEPATPPRSAVSGRGAPIDARASPAG